MTKVFTILTHSHDQKRPYISPRASFEDEELDSMLLTSIARSEDTDEVETDTGYDPNDPFSSAKENIFEDFDYEADLGY